MAERVLGKRGSPRRRHLLILPILVTATVALFLITGAQAVHDDNLFDEIQPAFRVLDGARQRRVPG